ncbi:MAG: hypothetical protein ACT4O0_05865 [Pseudonocardia sp.]
MLEGQDGSLNGALVDTHNLLLSLAGLVDDELLGWARELAAVGESDYAFELIIATVSADRLRLPQPVHAALLVARRGQPAAELPAPEPEPTMAHRFLADPAAAGFPAAIAGAFPVSALETLPGRLLRNCRLWLTWRLTPAGSASVPAPHPVLLIETADHDGADLLAYQVADLLWQAGVFASVEVFGADASLGEYHRAALDAANPLDGTGGVESTSSGAGSAAPAAPAAPVTPARRADPVSQPGVSQPGVSSAGVSRPGGPAALREASRPPLHPVDRVITARSSAPRGPDGPIPFGGPDNVTPFERPAQERPDADADRRGPFDPFDQGEDDADRPVRDSGRPPVRDHRWPGPRDQRVPPRGEQPASRQPSGIFGPGERQPALTDRPATDHNGPPPVDRNGPPADRTGPPLPERRPAPPRPHDRHGAGPYGPGGANGAVPNGAGPNGAGPNGAGPDGAGPDRSGVGGTAATRAVPPVKPPPPQMTQPPMGPPSMGQAPPTQPPMKSSVNQPTGRQMPVRPPMPLRPPVPPADLPDLPDGLSDVEQRLLRQLHEELAAREDNGLPLADQPPQRMFRNTNGGGRRPGPPQRPSGPSDRG